MMNETNCVVITTNVWRVPSVERAFSGILEGNPSESEKHQMIREAKAARSAWKPSDEGMEQVKQLRAFEGCRVKIQFWDSCMWLIEQEGPYPVEAYCNGITLLNDDGFLQAYLMVTDVKELPNKDGYSPSAYFIKRADCEYLLAPFADLYQVSKVTGRPE